MEITKKTGSKPITMFVLVMLTVSMMASLRNLPLVATYGYSALALFLIVGLFFLIPSALISAELATGWPKDGGVYIWVREAFGDRWGFLAVWMQWVHNVSWFPAILTFVAVTFASIFENSALANSKPYVLSVVLFGFWGLTFLNFKGIKFSSLMSTIGVIAGTIIPGAFIIILGMIWFGKGYPPKITLSVESLIPRLTFDNVSFLALLFLAFCGLEVAATHAGSVENPKKNYPKSIVYGAIITFILMMLGALSIAIVLDKTNIDLVKGLMETYKIFLSAYHMEWLTPTLALLLIIGAVAELNSWIAGPIKGLYSTAIHGNLPPLLQKKNQAGMPSSLLIVQGIIATIASLIIVFMPNMESAFWILSALSAQTYLVMYILLFMAGIRLKYSQPKVPRTYVVPFKLKGMWLLGSMGIISSLFGIIVGYLPTKQLGNLSTKELIIKECFLIGGMILLAGIPLVIYQCRRPHWNLLPKAKDLV